MKRQIITALLLPAWFVLACGVAWAAEQAPQRGAPQAAAAEARDDRTQPLDETTPRGLVRSATVINMNVQNPRGESLGHINDIVVDLDEGKVRYAALSFGGFLGLGQRLYAIPWEALDFKLVEGEVFGHQWVAVYDTTREKLDRAPGFKSDDWPDVADRDWATGVDSFFGVDRTRRTAEAEETRPARAIVRASQVTGMSVQSPEDRALGHLEELVINVEDGSVRYAVLAYGGFLGVGDRLFAVPLESLEVQRKDDELKLVFDVDIEKLKEAPGFERDAWPATADPRWSAEIDEYYRPAERGRKIERQPQPQP